MVTKIADSNLAKSGSFEDKAAKKDAAKHDPMWKDAGTKVGVQIWRVENKRTEHDAADFGVHHWPEKDYGVFYRGDSYIVLETRKNEEDKENEHFLWDIFYWIGSESTQDEYGVAAYKANELDDLLDGTPTQHRVCEGYETEEFLDLFPHIHYLDGGIDSGFRNVDAGDDDVSRPTRLHHVRRREDTKKMRIFQTKVSHASLNHGDAFVLDDSDVIYTWFGKECSAFEKFKANKAAHALAKHRWGKTHVVTDVGDNHQKFWELLGGKGPIKDASEVQDDKMAKETPTRMARCKEVHGKIEVTDIEPSKNNLDTNAVCAVDIGPYVFLWVGKKSNTRERNQAMVLTQQYIDRWDRSKMTAIVRVIEGEEWRVRAWEKAFA